MAMVHQSIDVKAPVHVLYNQLTRFEDYPRFMKDVDSVQQLDDTHLHWTTRMASGPVEWDAEISEQEPDRCLVWRNTRGPTNTGRVEVQEMGPDSSRVTFTLEAEPQQAPSATAGSDEQEMAQRLQQDLACLKEFIESRISGSGAWRGEIHDTQVTLRDRDARGQAGGQTAGTQMDKVAELGTRQGSAHAPAPAGGQTTDQAADPQQSRNSPPNSPVSPSGYAAGSEGFTGEEEPASPVASWSETPAQQRNESARAVSSQQSPAAAASVQPQAGRLAQPAAMRHVGQMPQDTTMESHGGSPSSDAMGNPMQQGRQEAKGDASESQQPGTGKAADDTGDTAGSADADIGAKP